MIAQQKRKSARLPNPGVRTEGRLQSSHGIVITTLPFEALFLEFP
jgi:hypothetical protein